MEPHLIHGQEQFRAEFNGTVIDSDHERILVCNSGNLFKGGLRVSVMPDLSQDDQICHMAWQLALSE
jgi:hypothetical protein